MQSNNEHNSSYQKIEVELSKNPAKKTGIDLDVVVVESVKGNVEISIGSAKNVPQDISKQDLKLLLDHMSSTLEGGVRSRAVISGEVEGDVIDSIGNIDFASFNPSKGFK